MIQLHLIGFEIDTAIPGRNFLLCDLESANDRLLWRCRSATGVDEAAKLCRLHYLKNDQARQRPEQDDC